MEVIGMSNAAYAMSPRFGVRYGWAARRRREGTDRKSVSGSSGTDTNDNGHITEEPCEMETLTHGSEAERRRRLRRL